MNERVALLVEDDGLTAALCSDWLREAGWRVVHVPHGGDALQRFAAERPALVLCDLVLPGVDGATLCASIRLQPFGERVAIVLMSSRSNARPAALAAGADAFLAKPVRREELLSALEHRPEPPPLAPSSAPEPVRVPTIGEGGTRAPEEGHLGPGVMPALLRRLLAARFSGVLEAVGTSAAGEPLKVKLFFNRGCPAAARSNDAETELGRVLEDLGILSAAHLAESVEEGRRTGLPMGEVLLRSRLLERRAVERALREQVLRRAVGVGRMREGRYVVSHTDTMGLAGFDVHPAAIEWRLDPNAAAPPSAAEGEHHVRVDVSPTLWPLVDPENQLGVLRALLQGGASVADCLRVGGPIAGHLLGLLRDYGLLLLSVDAPLPAQRDAGLAELDVDGLAARIQAHHTALADANHYTVLGVRPDADAEAVSVATMSGLALFHPDALPAALDADARRRARAIYDRVLEAGRVLGDPARRVIYDARLAGDAHLPTGDIGHEDHAVLQAERARELLRKGEFVTAAALFLMATRLEGEAADVLAMLGWARHNACPDDPAAGEPELRRALEINPDDEFALTYLGRLLGRRGEPDEARRLLRAAVAKNHEFDLARDALQELGE
jgi:CheY-like chemotaxis protein/tetratricopeptide (TPR) repeat protein